MDTKDYSKIFETSDVEVEPDMYALTPNNLQQLVGEWPTGVAAFTDEEEQETNVYNGKSNLDPVYLGDGFSLAVLHQEYNEAGHGYNPKDPKAAIHQHSDLSENDKEVLQNLEEKGDVEILGELSP